MGHRDGASAQLKANKATGEDEAEDGDKNESEDEVGAADDASDEARSESVTCGSITDVRIVVQLLSGDLGC